MKPVANPSKAALYRATGTAETKLTSTWAILNVTFKSYILIYFAGNTDVHVI